MPTSNIHKRDDEDFVGVLPRYQCFRVFHMTSTNTEHFLRVSLGIMKFMRLSRKIPKIMKILLLELQYFIEIEDMRTVICSILSCN